MADSINQDFIYVSVYDRNTGERKTSYVTGVHAETLEELEKFANSEYPNDICVIQSSLEYNVALQKDLLYINGKYQNRPEKTEAEIKQEKLNSLDNEYSQKIGEVESEIIKAQAIEDTELLEELRSERVTLVSEYEQKRGEI